MNDSTSAISPVWPTRWPKNSFSGFWTWLSARSYRCSSGPPPSPSSSKARFRPISPLLFDIGIALQFAVEARLSRCSCWRSCRPSRSSACASWVSACRATATLGIALVGAVAMVVVSDGSAATSSNPSPTAPSSKTSSQIFKTLHDPTAIVVFAVFAVVFAPFARRDVLPRLLLQSRPALRRVLGWRGRQRRALRHRTRRRLRGAAAGARRHRAVRGLLHLAQRVCVDDLARAVQRPLHRSAPRRSRRSTK